LPTFERLLRFNKDYDALSPSEKTEFKEAVKKFIDDLRAGEGFRKGLRVKGVKGAPGVFEMTWADNGRATFSFEKSRKNGEPHIIWRRVGTHDILG
jgi:hypothetical protein